VRCRQEVEKLSPALGGLIHLHEPEFVKVHGTSVAIHHHLAGVGATGLDVQPCLVRLGAAGAPPARRACSGAGRAGQGACCPGRSARCCAPCSALCALLARRPRAPSLTRARRAAGAVVAPSLIDVSPTAVSPTAVSLGATGTSVSPALISVGCAPAPDLTCRGSTGPRRICMRAGRLTAWRARPGCSALLAAPWHGLPPGALLQRLHGWPEGDLRSRAARRPKLISVGASSGPGIANKVEFNPVLIRVAPTWEVLPAEAGVGPVLLPDPVKIDPTPGRVVVTPPLAPGAFAADRAAVQAAARARAQPAP